MTAKTTPTGGIDGRGAGRAALIVFGAALALRLIYLGLISQSPYFDVRQMVGTDNFTFYEWAGRIAAGDMIGEGEFYLPPLYPYLLALLLKLSGPWFLIGPRLFQALMGAGTAALAALLAGRLGRPRAALLAGLLVALHGPLIFYELQFLRTGLLAFLYTLLVYVMMQAQDRPGARIGFAVGALAAVALIAKPTIAALAPAVPVWLWLGWQKMQSAEGAKQRFARFGLAMAVGFAMLFAVLVARNAAADAPLFSISRRGALEFAAGNLPGSNTEGWFLTQEALDLTLASNRSLALTVWRVLQAWREQPLGFIARQLEKTGQYLNGYEIPNNVNYYVERHYIRLFWLPLVSWPLVLAAGLLGMGVARGRREAFVPYAFAWLYSAGVVAFYVLGRFRLPMVPVICAFGGLGLDWLLSVAHRREWRKFAPAFILLLVVTAVALPRPDDPLRQSDYYNLVRFHVLRREPARAFEWLDQGRKSVEAQAGKIEPDVFHYQRAWYMFIAGDSLDSVAAELAPATRSVSPVTRLSVDQLSREIERRRKSGDEPRPLGFRFMP